jgi:PAS domain S-box-containing protein
VTEPGSSHELEGELVHAFTRLAEGDFSVRVPRNYKRDHADALAFFVNLIAEQLDRLLAARERSRVELEAGVAVLSARFLSFAAGDFTVRADRSGDGSPLDLLAGMFNTVANEVARSVLAREQQRAALEAIVEAMIDGVLLLDANATILRSNGAMAELLGHDAASLVGRPLAEILVAEERDFASRLGELARRSAFRDRETRFLGARGQTVAMAVNGSPQRDPAGALLGVVLVARDERELKDARAQLHLSDRLATMGTVAAGIAHEINNPLAFIIANLSFVSEELADLDIRAPAERLAEIHRALVATRGGAERVKVIVRDLRAFSRSNEETRVPVALRRVLEIALGLIQNELRHSARIEVSFEGAPTVDANEGRLIQLFLNLLQNAAQAIPPGAAELNTIRIATGTDPSGDAFVVIADTGAGISPEHLSRIFEPFFTTKPVGVGTGLGLSICQKILSSLGGRLEVKSQLGRGSEFRVVLPRSSGQHALPTVDVTSVAPVRPIRLLVVDDEPEVGEALLRVLGREHVVDAVTSAARAIELVREHRYDVILCDLLMPDMTGMELYDLLCASHPDVARRVVFMTGGPFHEGSRAFLERIPNAWIDKPFDPEALAQLLSQGLPAR